MSAVLKDPRTVVSKALFGDKLSPVNINELSRRTGISESTLRRYRARPAAITLDRLAVICRVRGLGDDEVGKIVKSYMGGKK